MTARAPSRRRERPPEATRGTTPEVGATCTVARGATARVTGATLWTQDADFEGVAGVRYFAKALHEGRAGR